MDRALVERAATAYEEDAPFYTVEQEAVETLPDAFATGEFGRRDAIWVVEWYYRREAGAVSNRDRREREAAFEENDRQTVKRAVVDAATAEDLDDAFDVLVELEGVDTPVASAFLFFADPDRYLVVGETEWGVLSDAGHLDQAYPDPPSRNQYETYLDTCRALADQFDCNHWTLYRAIRQLSTGWEE